jgi:hypothetical protein
MYKLMEVHLREPERFKSIMLHLDSVSWILFEEKCQKRGITPAIAIADFIDREGQV